MERRQAPNRVNIREYLTIYLEDAADDRAHEADDRNDPDGRLAAAAFRAAADYVRRLPETDDRFRRLDDAFQQAGIMDIDPDKATNWLRDPERVGLRLGKRSDLDAIAIRYGYREVTTDPGDFVSALVEYVVEHLPRRGQREGSNR